ncbi:MAG: hypothetical protein FGM14_16535, partial [Flavobacteriales bacterium]|nr:hypothetical protein [Flavobacteriales bacterium]
MATIKYRIKGKNDLATIYVRVRDGQTTDLENSTGYIINPNFWNDEKNEPKQTAKNPDKLNLKIQLDRLRLFISESLNTDKGTATPINKDWLDLVIAKFKNPLLEQKTEYLIDLVREYQTEMKTKANSKTGKPISKLTIVNFNTTLMRLEKFEKHKKKRYLISEVDLTFKNDFVKFESEKLSLSQNSIAKD